MAVMGALEMLWACEYEYMRLCTRPPLLLLPLSQLHHFNCLSVGNKQSLCPLMWEAQEKSEGAHPKKNSAGASRPHCAPHLQIASDATETKRVTATPKRHLWVWVR